MNALELEDIKMQFNQKVLFENLDLAIEKGTINTIMGESGSGKSTLLNIIGLLLKPTAGAINILYIKLKLVDNILAILNINF